MSNSIKKEHSKTQNRLHSHLSGGVLEHWWCHNPPSLCCWMEQQRQATCWWLHDPSVYEECNGVYNIYLYPPAIATTE